MSGLPPTRATVPIPCLPPRGDLWWCKLYPADGEIHVYWKYGNRWLVSIYHLGEPVPLLAPSVPPAFVQQYST
jgi:hypothetical protein